MKRFMIMCKEFNRQMSRQNISAFASSTAFFFFLSLIPMTIVVCTIIPYTPLTEENLIEVAQMLLPETMDGLLIGIISQVYEKSAGILSVAVLVTIWSAGKGILALIRGLNAINNVVENRNYLVLRLVSSFYTVIVLVVLILSLIVMVFGNVLIQALGESHIGVHYLYNFFLHFRFLFVWGILIFIFAAIYTFVPNKKMKFTMQIPGAFFATIAWVLFSWGFSIYIDNYEGITAYGTLSIIIAMLLWFYIGIYIIMIGAYINRYFRGDYKNVYRKIQERRTKKRSKP